MARLVDVIEMMIKQMLDENNGSATISRSDLAERANCVPSQITYVLSTRFSSGNGYIVESRRGGGGQITITRAKIISKREYIQSVLESVGNDLTQQQAKIYSSASGKGDTRPSRVCPTLSNSSRRERRRAMFARLEEGRLQSCWKKAGHDGSGRFHTNLPLYYEKNPEKAAEEFDSSFPPREKLRLPGQLV